MMTITSERIRWPLFCFGMLLTAICALSVHTVMLQALGIPFPDLAVFTTPCRFAMRAVQILALLVFWRVASRHIRRSFFVQWGLLFLIFSMLAEVLFRAPFMAGYCTNAWVFAFVSNIPTLLGIATMCAMVVAASPHLRRPWQLLVAATIMAALATFAFSPLISMAFAPLMKAMASLAPQSEWCTLPYGLNVLVPAYLSFAEPTLACVAVALLVWDKLPASRAMRFVAFSVLIVAIKNQLLTPFLYAALAKGSFLPGLASEGQFALEALALAVLTGVTVEWSIRRFKRASN
ncbi:hypothetical protein ACPPVV_10745 [Rhodanobacter sp. Col0626]|uniref:hypothetical protein n=1 Tax=Rhodanobacter sp. Col0626 TaxID=3415679 RepID=UPI003CF881F4